MIVVRSCFTLKRTLNDILNMYRYKYIQLMPIILSLSNEVLLIYIYINIAYSKFLNDCFIGLFKLK